MQKELLFGLQQQFDYFVFFKYSDKYCVMNLDLIHCNNLKVLGIKLWKKIHFLENSIAS